MEASEPGDNEAWMRELMIEYREPLVRYLRRYAPNASDVETIVQDTWIAAWQAKQQGEREDWRPWLFRTAHNIACDHRKWAYRVYDLLQVLVGLRPVDRHDGHVGFTETWMDIAKAAKTLTTKEYGCLFLHAADELTDDEIAERLQISVANVRVQRSRARRKLRKAMDKMGGRDGSRSTRTGGAK